MSEEEGIKLITEILADARAIRTKNRITESGCYVREIGGKWYAYFCDGKVVFPVGMDLEYFKRRNRNALFAGAENSEYGILSVASPSTSKGNAVQKARRRFQYLGVWTAEMTQMFDGVAVSGI